jgi:hypothetical protein
MIKNNMWIGWSKTKKEVEGSTAGRHDGQKRHAEWAAELTPSDTSTLLDPLRQHKIIPTNQNARFLAAPDCFLGTTLWHLLFAM